MWQSPPAILLSFLRRRKGAQRTVKRPNRPLALLAQGAKSAKKFNGKSEKIFLRGPSALAVPSFLPDAAVKQQNRESAKIAKNFVFGLSSFMKYRG
jgi:hypothetical protein